MLVAAAAAVVAAAVVVSEAVAGLGFAVGRDLEAPTGPCVASYRFSAHVAAEDTGRGSSRGLSRMMRTAAEALLEEVAAGMAGPHVVRGS